MATDQKSVLLPLPFLPPLILTPFPLIAKTTPPPAPLKWSLSSTDKQNLLKIMAEYSPTLSDDGEKVKLDEKIVFDEEVCVFVFFLVLERVS